MGSLVKFPGLGFLKAPSSVKPMDVVVGAVAGAVGTIALAKVLPASASASLPDVVKNNMPVVGGAATAAILYYAQKRKNPTRAGGHAIGALVGTAAVWLSQQTQPGGLFAMAGLVKFPGLSAYGAPIFQNPTTQGLSAGLGAYGGPIFANPRTNMNMGRLARMQGLGDDNDDGLFPAP